MAAAAHDVGRYGVIVDVGGGPRRSSPSCTTGRTSPRSSLRARRHAAGTTGTALLVIERQFALPAAKLSNLNRWTRDSTVSGLLDVVHDQGDPSTRRYRLPTEVVKIMTDAQASATSRLSSRPGPRRREQRAARRSDISESVIHQPMSGR